MGKLSLPQSGSVYLDANCFIYSVEKIENLFRKIFNSYEVRLIPTTTAIWEQAANIRANNRLKTPDAIHAATALANNSTLFITNDI